MVASGLVTDSAEVSRPAGAVGSGDVTRSAKVARFSAGVTRSTAVMRRVRQQRSALLREVLGFAAVGLGAYASDLALFVWLRGSVGLGPLQSKALSFVAGCTVAYAGNAFGTYRRRGGPCLSPGSGSASGSGRFAVRLHHIGLFFAVNLAGAVVQMLCLGMSHYGLGFTSARADTVSGAGVGMALATVLRFWATRRFVFGTERDS
jgi:putative flippase GtrA